MKMEESALPFAMTRMLGPGHGTTNGTLVLLRTAGESGKLVAEPFQVFGRKKTDMMLPPDVKIIEESRLFTWRPHGVLDEAKVNKILAFIVEQETKFGRDFDRFTDTSALK